MTQSYSKLLLTTGEVAKLCDVYRNTIRVWVSRGKLSSFKTVSGYHLFSEEDVLKFIELRKLGLDKESPRAKQYADELLFASDVATLFGISRGTVWKWAKNGRIPVAYYCTSGGILIYKKEDIENLLVNKQSAEELLTIGEVAKLFNVCTNTIRRWSDRGELRCFYTLSGRRQYSRKDVDALLKVQ